MEISPDPLEFTSEDVINWRTFLKTQTGTRLIPKVLEEIPPLFAGGDTNKILIRNGELIGFQSAVRVLLVLANPPAEQKTLTNFPDLMDDDAWKDGNKLTSE